MPKVNFDKIFTDGYQNCKKSELPPWNLPTIQSITMHKITDFIYSLWCLIALIHQNYILPDENMYAPFIIPMVINSHHASNPIAKAKMYILHVSN